MGHLAGCPADPSMYGSEHAVCLCPAVLAAPEIVAVQARVERAKANVAAVERWLETMPARWLQRSHWERQLPIMRGEVVDAEERLAELLVTFMDIERATAKRRH